MGAAVVLIRSPCRVLHIPFWGCLIMRRGNAFGAFFLKDLLARVEKRPWPLWLQEWRAASQPVGGVFQVSRVEFCSRMKTFSAKPAEVQKKWFIVDATDLTLGRLATQIAYVLRGKHKPIFTPHVDTGDNIIVINADKVKLAGNKEMTKLYHRHTGYFGGLKTFTAAEVRVRHPERLIETAVKGMLPHNVLGRELFRNLRVYNGAAHPHEGQKPEPLPQRTTGVSKLR
jgi:large subunit ribosomal protein L13